MASDPPYTTFILPVGTAYRAKLLDFVQVDNQIQATIEVEPEIWETVDMVMLFHLQWNDRNEGSVSGDKPVQIKMFLGPEVYTSLSNEKQLITNRNDFFQTDEKHPIRSAYSWYATEVTEEVELPDVLKDKGTLREGFTTKWKEALK
ncbi:hypothetical protein N7E81_13065 [Reichenbachiella carrageenanivorans]|uniref:Uncharacterized protein n=1 Tax=Reichenbachiella carrageenanivorans TaxID=2979869 RepID=A0ABY6CWI9_9BACT|nr:hypothetical protein [Reichenbachiella carrageenanivorans]UXX78286.1 hypothetical protein N7E81_13065 [Reichenbachiella carrageenanivorans]